MITGLRHRAQENCGDPVDIIVDEESWVRICEPSEYETPCWCF